MPIDIDTFERETEFESKRTHAERVLSFLLSNDEQAFKRREIADSTGIDPNAVSAVLSRLKERNLVRHKPPYWAAGDPQRIRSATDLSRSLESLDERLGSEDMDAWRDAGADARHPSQREADES
ncbi:MarR family transcriptional regulator [Natrinema versiforme]|uniref:Sugar-specific transcriptional regulator TrmB n=1 Tax=Natrinema versiforme JCM 10478 TaxID=1227496 RepID=L9Y6Z9_9EURY|nr:helix-turn-helix domain-containing protein [Natrinema versiforme]ELY68693.1 sugar-specific transcriptional regulator TrmB [Natrinema versiforme JCM 10478]